MALELILQLKGISNSVVKLDGRVPRNGEGLAVGRERVVGDRAVEKVVDFGSSHF